MLFIHPLHPAMCTLTAYHALSRFYVHSLTGQTRYSLFSTEATPHCKSVQQSGIDVKEVSLSREKRKPKNLVVADGILQLVKRVMAL